MSDIPEGPKIIILPGNGGGDVWRANWYGAIAKQLTQAVGKGGDLEGKYTVILRNMPDPVYARAAKWLPFVENDLKCTDDSIIVGHSSGAEAAMRYAETHRLKAIILVSACHTDLGEESERISGYYDDPWQWEEIRKNCQHIVQYGSPDDPFIPWSEMTLVHESLGSEMVTMPKRGHFMTERFPELYQKVIEVGKR